MTKQPLTTRIIVTAIPFVFIFIVLIVSIIIRPHLSKIPPCSFYETTGYLCPACGNTRFVYAVLHFDFLRAAKANFSLFVYILVGGLWYLELVFWSYGKKVKTGIRNIWFYVFIILFLISYWIVRNLPGFEWMHL